MTATTVTWATKAAQRGFTVAQNVVLFDERLPTPARLLYVQLAHYAWRNPDAFPTQEEIAANMGVSDRQLRRYAAALEERWLLDRRERGRGQSVEYMLHEPSQDYLEREPRAARQAKRRLEVVSSESSSDTDVRPSSDTHVREARTLMSDPSLLVEAAAVQDLEKQDLDLQPLPQDEEEREDPAAAQAPPIFSTGVGGDSSITDRAIREAVATFRDADAGSPAIVIPEAHSLPATVFADVVERAHTRRGGVGLLITFLRIARAERATAFSAQLARELGQTAPAYVPAPWLIDSLKRDDPERYVRIMAASPSYQAQWVSDALSPFVADVAPLVELFGAVRAGKAAADQLGTPEQERARWVAAHADDPDAHAVIDAWDDVDPIERQALHERIEQRSDDDSTRKAA